MCVVISGGLLFSPSALKHSSLEASVRSLLWETFQIIPPRPSPSPFPLPGSYLPSSCPGKAGLYHRLKSKYIFSPFLSSLCIALCPCIQEVPTKGRREDSQVSNLFLGLGWERGFVFTPPSPYTMPPLPCPNSCCLFCAYCMPGLS